MFAFQSFCISYIEIKDAAEYFSIHKLDKRNNSLRLYESFIKSYFIIIYIKKPKHSFY